MEVRIQTPTGAVVEAEEETMTGRAAQKVLVEVTGSETLVSCCMAGVEVET